MTNITFPPPAGYIVTPWTDQNGNQWIADSKGRFSHYVAPPVAVVDAITNGDMSPVTSNAVFDIAATKANLSGATFTGSVLATNLSGTNTGDQTSVSGNAGTVTSIGNLTGVITSVNRATSITNGAITNVMLANGAVANLSGANTGNETAASIATALNAGTQDSTASGTDRIAITSPSGGWMLLGTLWTWVKAQIDLGQTWAGLQSFTTRPRSSAVLVPTNTTELITQADMLPEFLQFIPTALPLSTTTGTANTNGSNTGNSAIITVLNTAVAGNYREVVCSSIPIHRSGSGANIRFADSKFTLLFDLSTNGLWNSEYRFLFGVDNIQTLAAAGIGMVWTGQTSGVIQIHDGTTLYTQAFTIAGFDFNLTHKFALIWNAGTLKLYWKGWNDYNPEGRFALVATLTRAGLPTVSSGTTCKFVNWVTAASPGSAMSLNIREAKFLSMAPALV